MDGTNILDYFGIDPFYIMLGQTVLTLILLIVVIVCIFKIKRLYRSYDYFMRGKDAETLEDIIIDHIHDIQELKSQDRANKDQIRINNKNMRASFQKFGMVKYNAFKGMGGNLSFAFALLDYTCPQTYFTTLQSSEQLLLFLLFISQRLLQRFFLLIS